MSVSLSTVKQTLRVFVITEMDPCLCMIDVCEEGERVARFEQIPARCVRLEMN